MQPPCTPLDAWRLAGLSRRTEVVVLDLLFCAKYFKNLLAKSSAVVDVSQPKNSDSHGRLIECYYDDQNKRPTLTMYSATASRVGEEYQ